jgi:hypothetical protein
LNADPTPIEETVPAQENGNGGVCHSPKLTASHAAVSHAAHRNATRSESHRFGQPETDVQMVKTFAA